MFWTIYMNALKSNTLMKKIQLKYFREIYNRDHIEILDMLMSAIQNNRSIKMLNINMKGCSLNRLPQLPLLEILEMNAKMDAQDLVDYCETNQRLIRLDFESNEIYGKLTDILPHCENLVSLTFRVKKHFDDSEYTQFAKLPSLKYLKILGAHKSGSLCPLLKSLATKEPKTLEYLCLSPASMEREEIFEACRINSLKQFKCRFINVKDFYLTIDYSKGNESLIFKFKKETDATDLAFLSNLTEFTSLRIFGKHKAGTLKPFLKAIAETESPKLVSLEIEKYEEGQSANMFNNDEILEVFKIKSLKTLHCGYFDWQPMEFPTNLPKIRKIAIESETSVSLRNLFKGLAQQIPSELDSLAIRGSPMSLEDLMEIRKIERLKNLTCGLVDVNTMHHLSQLTQLKVLKITSKHPRHDFSKAVLWFYETSKGNVSIYSKANWIKRLTKKGELIIKITPDINTAELLPLASLPNLYNLLIRGRHHDNSLASLFKACASSKSTALQLLSIENNISSIEVKEIAQLKTLRYLECGFSDSQSLQHLKHLPELVSLTISSSHNFPDIADGVLSVLMGCSNEIRVIRNNREIKFNKNLSKLTIIKASNDSYDSDGDDTDDDDCDDDDSDDDISDVSVLDVYAPLAELPLLRSLHIIGRHKLGAFKNLFRALALNDNQNLEEIVFKPILNYEETLELSQIASLKRLTCGFFDVECVEPLIKLANLQELTITRYPEDFLKQFLQDLATRELSNLQSLSLTNNILTFEDIAGVARVNSLKRLECTFADAENIHLLANLNQLEELTISAHECNSLVTLFHALFLSEPKTLQHLRITGRSISYEEMTIVARIKTLRGLCCTLIDKESIKLLDQLPELTKLSIELYAYDAEGIEILAQLNYLTDLKVKSLKSGSLTGLFNQFASRADPIIQSLIITGNKCDSTEIDAIAQLKTLRRLQCGFEENKFYECLSNLTNIEVLKITSKLDFSDNSQTLLTTLQKCHKLKVIEIQDGDEFVDSDFISEAYKTLKTVRNPQTQEALELRIRDFKCLTPEQILISDKSYLTIYSFEDDYSYA